VVFQASVPALPQLGQVAAQSDVSAEQFPHTHRGAGALAAAVIFSGDGSSVASTV
jgi:hypothetical protein